MENQLLLVFGLVLLVCGIAAYSNPHYFRQILGSYSETPALLYIGGILNLIIGLLLVINFSAWITFQEAIVAFIGVLGVVKGFLMVMFPRYSLGLSKSLWKDRGHLKGEAIVMIIFGVVTTIASLI